MPLAAGRKETQDALKQRCLVKKEKNAEGCFLRQSVVTKEKEPFTYGCASHTVILVTLFMSEVSVVDADSLRVFTVFVSLCVLWYLSFALPLTFLSNVPGNMKIFHAFKVNHCHNLTAAQSAFCQLKWGCVRFDFISRQVFCFFLLLYMQHTPLYVLKGLLAF